MSSSNAPLITYLIIGRMCVVMFTHYPPYSPVPTGQEAGQVPKNVAKGKICSSQESSAGHPAHKQSDYWLANPTVCILLTLVKLPRVKVEKPPAVSFTGVLALSINIWRCFLNLIFAVYHSQWYAAFKVWELCNKTVMLHIDQGKHLIWLRHPKETKKKDNTAL